MIEVARLAQQYIILYKILFEIIPQHSAYRKKVDKNFVNGKMS